VNTTKSCSELNNDCQTGQCDILSGNCYGIEKPNGTVCTGPTPCPGTCDGAGTCVENCPIPPASPRCAK
jgi:hypothetical protein